MRSDIKDIWTDNSKTDRLICGNFVNGIPVKLIEECFVFKQFFIRCCCLPQNFTTNSIRPKCIVLKRNGNYLKMRFKWIDWRAHREWCLQWKPCGFKSISSILSIMLIIELSFRLIMGLLWIVDVPTNVDDWLCLCCRWETEELFRKIWRIDWMDARRWGMRRADGSLRQIDSIDEQRRDIKTIKFNLAIQFTI